MNLKLSIINYQLSIVNFSILVLLPAPQGAGNNWERFCSAQFFHIGTAGRPGQRRASFAAVEY